MAWFAEYHYIFVHFPIALVVMAGIAELINSLSKKGALDTTVNFLLFSAVLFFIPTIATGLSLEEIGRVSEANRSNFEWHETFAFITVSLTTISLILRLWIGKHPLYYLLLLLSVISVMITAHFGGAMAFGPMDYIPS